MSQIIHSYILKSSYRKKCSHIFSKNVKNIIFKVTQVILGDYK